MQTDKEHKQSQGKLYASEIVTLALLYALKGSDLIQLNQVMHITVLVGVALWLR